MSPYTTFDNNSQGKRIWLSPKVVALGDVGKKAGGQRARKYDQKVLAALKSVWKILDYLCGKRLVGILPEVVPILERHGELKVDANTRERLIQISGRHHRSAAGAREAQAPAYGALWDQAGNAAQTPDSDQAFCRLARGPPRFLGSGPGGP